MRGREAAGRKNRFPGGSRIVDACGEEKGGCIGRLDIQAATSAKLKHPHKEQPVAAQSLV